MLIANSDVRYGFTNQFLLASALFARRCKEIERDHPDNPDERILTEHRGLVVAAIMQSVAAIETEAAELVMYGPEHHRGSNAVNEEARKFLAPFADVIDDQDVLERYVLILHLLRKPLLEKGKQPWQDMATLVKLRNELVHYKSKWGSDMERQSRFDRFQQLRLAKPPFIGAGQNFFPHQCLSAARAKWAVQTAVAFLNAVDDRLEVEHRLTSIMGEITGL
jgi:hypothetical protein